MLRRLVCCALLCLAAGPATAALFNDDEARARIEKLRADMAALQQSVETASRNQIDFANQSENLRIEVAKLRGQLEVLINEMDSTQKRQRDFYADLDTRLRKLEGGPAATATMGGADTGGKPVDEAAASRDYEAALAHVRGGRFREAITAFTAFTKNHPGSEKMPAAYSWLGASHYQLREYPRAIENYGKVVAGWPNDVKAPDAMLGQASAQIDSGDAKSGNKTLEALIQQYPKSPAAQSARLRLNR